MIDLVDFCDKVAARVEAESDAVVHFGRAHLTRQDNQGPGTANRVVIAPGKPEDDTWGTVRVANKTHVLVQPDEAIHSELVTVDVWAYDGTGYSNERLQYRAIRGLWQCVVRAIGYVLRSEGHTSTWWESQVELDSSPRDRRHGERARIVFEIDFAVRAPTPTELVQDLEPALTAEVEH